MYDLLGGLDPERYTGLGPTPPRLVPQPLGTPTTDWEFELFFAQLGQPPRPTPHDARERSHALALAMIYGEEGMLRAPGVHTPGWYPL
jgi:hypothetical protein